MKYEYHFYHTLTILCRIENEDFYFLYECAKRHYDYTVKAMTEQGGFLFGWKNRRELFSSPEDDRKEIEFKSTDLQLCMKAIEFDGSDQCNKVYRLLFALFEKLQLESKNVNENVVKHFI